MLRSYGDSKVFGEAYGEGPTKVLWLHGWARRGDDFVLAASALAEQGISSVALDLPGFGASPAPGIAGGARLYAELLLDTIQEIATEPLVVVGHSFGGRIGTVVASRHPELVRYLVLTGVPLLRLAPTTKSPLPYRTSRWAHKKGLLSDARMETARQKYGSTDYRRAQGIIRDVLVATVNETYEPELAALRVPVSMLWGETDTEAPVAVAERASALITSPHSLRVLPGVGHFLPLEVPGEINTTVVEALHS